MDIRALFGKLGSHYMQTLDMLKNESRDYNTKVGAIVVDASGLIIGEGHNEMPRGCEGFWDKPVLEEEKSLNDEELREKKNHFVLHAEVKAILYALMKRRSVKNCAMISTIFPSNECAKVILECEISTVVYKNEKLNNPERDIPENVRYQDAIDYLEEPSTMCAKEMLIDRAGIKVYYCDPVDNTRLVELKAGPAKENSMGGDSE